MQIENPLPGYAPDDYPQQVDQIRATEMGNLLREAGCRVLYICMSMTSEPLPVKALLREIVSTRIKFPQNHAVVNPKQDTIVGPFIVDGQAVPGNAIAIWVLP